MTAADAGVGTGARALGGRGYRGHQRSALRKVPLPHGHRGHTEGFQVGVRGERAKVRRQREPTPQHLFEIRPAEVKHVLVASLGVAGVREAPQGTRGRAGV